ncbi:MAG TPA: phosphoenolpyruvate carboxylase, partial [Chromatiales bacterium]|nr:phosphoenolpyruvate carboxylase [Chromatiales bacterium]HEX22889.1 phosphoenolpyruvate carboxylase [Chromatiales bacterium]
MKQVPQHLPAIVPGDKELRSRVKLLGTLLGEALRQHAGQEVYDAVETLRKGFIRLRKTDSPARRQRLIRVIDELDGETLTHVVRAFSTYFSLVNIAEEGAQHRQRRRRRHSGDPFWTGSFHTVLREFRDAGLRPDDLQTLFDRLRFTPVITAHPTESRRTTINYALRRVFLASKQLDAPITHRQREGL